MDQINEERKLRDQKVANTINWDQNWDPFSDVMAN